MVSDIRYEMIVKIRYQKGHISYRNQNMGSSKKSCSKGILEACGLPGAKRIFAINTRTKDKFSRYLVVIKIMDIRHKICHIYYKNADFE